MPDFAIDPFGGMIGAMAKKKQDKKKRLFVL
jgi:hypothetical protein